jgi:5-bromo-4-chloroindolyl phosphate hydrolysis protein
MEAGSQRDRELRAARNQALFRAVNEKLRELNDAFSDVSETYAIACECADVSCVGTLQIATREYVDVREHPSRFFVLKDHVFPEVERVVAQNDGYVVVEKNEDVSEITEATAPRG